MRKMKASWNQKDKDSNWSMNNYIYISLKVFLKKISYKKEKKYFFNDKKTYVKKLTAFYLFKCLI